MKNQQPLMDKWEVDLIEKVLTKLQKDFYPLNCLEWGSGWSTVQFPRLIDETEGFWLSIEHKVDWYDLILPEIYNRELKHVDLHLVPDFLYFYTSHLSDQNKPYDFILVDGIHRSECFNKAYDIVRPMGIICCHDWNHKAYWERIVFYPEHTVIFAKETDYEPSHPDFRGLAFFSHVLDLKRWFNEIL